MSIIKQDYGELSGGVIKTGTFTPSTTSVDYTFDCGISNPDLVFVSNDRNNNDWSGLYVRAGSYFNYAESGLFSFSSNSRYMNAFANKITVNGSNVTVGKDIITANVPIKWMAIKQ